MPATNNSLNIASIINSSGKKSLYLSGSVIKGYYNSQDGKFYENYDGTTYSIEITGHKELTYITLDTNFIYRYNEDLTPPAFIQIGGSLNAEDISYDNTNSGITATNTQTAIDDFAKLNTFDVPANIWVDNTGDYTKKAIISTTDYTNDSAPIWQMVSNSGISTVPTRAEMDDMVKVEVAIFTDTDITLYAVTAPVVDLKLMVKGI